MIENDIWGISSMTFEESIWINKVNRHIVWDYPFVSHRGILGLSKECVRKFLKVL